MEKMEKAMFEEHNPGVHFPPFTQFAQGIETGTGLRWLSVSGQVAARADGTVAPDIETQLDEVWTKVVAILGSAGMSPANLVRIGGFVTERAFVPAFRAARERHVGGARPTSTLVIVAGLVDSRWLVEIEALAAAGAVAVRVGSVRRVVVAAPAYLRANGAPEHPRDLAKAHVIQALAVDGGAEWRFQERSRPLSVRLTPRLRMNTNDAVIDLVAGGWGLSRLMSYQVAPYLADGRLQSVLQDFEQAPLAVHVIHQEGRLVSKKVRTFVDDMVARLRSDPAIN